MTEALFHAAAAGSDAAAVIDITRQAGQPVELATGKVWVVNGPDGPTLYDLTGDKYATAPARIRRTAALTHHEALLAYWDKYRDDGSEMYADPKGYTLTAVLDAPHDGPSFETHTATLKLDISPELAAWMHNDGKTLSQEAFAEFIDDHMHAIADPPAADLLEMVQQFQATTTATFKAGFKLVNGARQLEYTEQVDATVKGDHIDVPTGITLHLPVFRGDADGVEVVAKLRYRINHNGPGKLGIGYKLVQVADIVDAAFEAVIAQVAQHIARPVFRGTVTTAK